MEGSRLRSTVGLYRDLATPQSVPDGTTTHTLLPGQTVFVDLVSASVDPIRFPNPLAVDLTRPMDAYIHYGWGPHQCLGYGVSKVAMMTMLKTVGGLKGLRRAKGDQGRLKTIPVAEGYKMYMTADWSGFFPFPTTMKVQWDDE